MSAVMSESEFEPSRDRQHYRPPHQLTRVERFVRAVSCLALFAAFGIIFAIGLSGCGGGDDEERATTQPLNCAVQPELCK